MNCREIMGYHSKSFSFATRYLSEQQRDSVAAIYAFARYVDDIVDDKVIPKFAINQNLDNIKSMLEHISEEDMLENPILIALEDTIERYHIPINYLHELIEGVRMDLNITEFVSMEELDLYCYRVASIIGVLSCYIFGVTHEIALEHAIELGKAMQITNILRDISYDFNIGRIYLPKVLRDKYQLKIEDIAMKKVTPPLISLMKAEIKRARMLYKEGEKGLPYLPKEAKFTVKLASRVYAGILSEIEKLNYNIYDNRAVLPKWKKIIIAFKIRIENFFER